MEVVIVKDGQSPVDRRTHGNTEVGRTNTGYSSYAQNYPIATTGNDLVELKIKYG
jgi:hypothetical protein